MQMGQLHCEHAVLPSSCYQGSDHNLKVHQLLFGWEYVTIPHQVRAFLWKCHKIECVCVCVLQLHWQRSSSESENSLVNSKNTKMKF